MLSIPISFINSTERDFIVIIDRIASFCRLLWLFLSHKDRHIERHWTIRRCIPNTRCLGKGGVVMVAGERMWKVPALSNSTSTLLGCLILWKLFTDEGDKKYRISSREKSIEIPFWYPDVRYPTVYRYFCHVADIIVSVILLLFKVILLIGFILSIWYANVLYLKPFKSNAKAIAVLRTFDPS